MVEDSELRRAPANTQPELNSTDSRRARPRERKAIYTWGSGPHAEFLEITTPVTSQYATRHGFDLVTGGLRCDNTEQTRTASVRPLLTRAGIRVVTALMNRSPVAARLAIRISGRQHDRMLLDRAVERLASFVGTRIPAPEPPAWQKLRLLVDALDRYDLVVWIDADAVIVQHDIDITSLLQEGSWMAAVEHKVGGRPPDHVNSGVLVLRSCTESRKFIREALSLQGFRFHPWWEQAAILYLLGYTLSSVKRERTTQAFTSLHILGDEWNSIPGDFVERPRIKHYAGVENSARAALLRRDVEEFAREQFVHPASFPTGD